MTYLRFKIKKRFIVSTADFIFQMDKYMRDSDVKDRYVNCTIEYLV